MREKSAIKGFGSVRQTAISYAAGGGRGYFDPSLRLGGGPILPVGELATASEGAEKKIYFFWEIVPKLSPFSPIDRGIAL